MRESCGTCGAQAPGYAKYCPRCGSAIPSPEQEDARPKICPKCGLEHEAHARYCKRDGTPLRDAPPAAPAEPEPLLGPQAHGPLTSSDVPLIEVPGRRPSTGKSQIQETRAAIRRECPLCGESYPLGIRFCARDGAPLDEVAEPRAVPPPAEAQHQARVVRDERATSSSPSVTAKALQGNRRRVKIAVGVITLVTSALAVILLLSRSSPARTTSQIRQELARVGLAAIAVHVGEDSVATLSGYVASPEDRELALSVAREHKSVRSVLDRIALSAVLEEPTEQAAMQPSPPLAEEELRIGPPDQVDEIDLRPSMEGSPLSDGGAGQPQRRASHERPRAVDERQSPVVESQSKLTPTAAGPSPQEQVPSALEAASAEGPVNDPPEPTESPDARYSSDTDPGSTALGTTVDQFNEMNELIVAIERLGKQALKSHEESGREEDALWERLTGFVEAARTTRREFRRATGTGIGGLVANVSSALRRNRGSRSADSRIVAISVADLSRQAAEVAALLESDTAASPTTLQYWRETEGKLARLAAMIGE